MKKATEQLYGCKITLYDSKYPNGNILKVLKWSGFKLHQFAKWGWYFAYREALLRIENPRKCIEMTRFTEPLTKKTEAEIHKQKLTSQKAKVTKYRNALRREEKNWDKLFPIEEDVFYKKALRKVRNAEKELKVLQSINEVN